METRTYTVYEFSELSEDAKQNAKNKHAELFGYSWGTEALESIGKLAEHFGGKVTRYSIDWFRGSHSSMLFEMPEMEPEEISARLAKLGTFDPETLKGHGDCALTGYSADEDAIDGFRKAFLKDGEKDLDALMGAAFNSWLDAGQADCEDQYTDEAFQETAESNEWMFEEDGTLA